MNRTHIDLCSGVGGFALASRWIGWETKLFCELDGFCQKVLRKNFGDVPIIGDVKNVTAQSVRESGITERPFIVTAGFPCQPFSQAGKREGVDDERHLFPQILRIVDELRPNVCVFENVRGLLSIGNGDVFEEVAASLENIGYAVQSFCIPACAVDVPHRRDRIWIIANADVEREQIRQTTDARQSGGFAGSDYSGVTSNANNERRDGRREQNQIRERQIHSGCGNDRTFGEPAIRESRIAGIDTDGNSTRQLQPERNVEEFGRRISDGDKQIAADANAQRLQRGELGRLLSERARTSRPITERYQNENWREAALRTCVRGVSDGLSDELHIAGSRDNRTNRLKALGNAAHPFVIYEIFKAIEYAENNYG